MQSKGTSGLCLDNALCMMLTTLDILQFKSKRYKSVTASACQIHYDSLARGLKKIHWTKIHSHSIRSKEFLTSGRRRQQILF